MKMAIVVALLSQDGSSNRLIGLSCFAVLAFLWQTGIIAALARNRRQNGNAEEPAGERQTPRPPPPHVLSLTEGGIAPGGGFVMDCSYFILSLLCSLVPSWHPRRAMENETVPLPPNVPPLQEQN
uniref:Uncharacterized protein n=1 Tax=Octactis speculum TaxID=3111310 RepID=A0A7S2C731_9STRA